MFHCFVFNNTDKSQIRNIHTSCSFYYFINMINDTLQICLSLKVYFLVNHSEFSFFPYKAYKSTINYKIPSDHTFFFMTELIQTKAIMGYPWYRKSYTKRQYLIYIIISMYKSVSTPWYHPQDTWHVYMILTTCNK